MTGINYTVTRNMRREMLTEQASMECIEWIQESLSREFNTHSLFEVLKGGDVLCELANQIQPNAIPKIKNPTIAFMAAENIKNFLLVLPSFGLKNIVITIFFFFFRRTDSIFNFQFFSLFISF